MGTAKKHPVPDRVKPSFVIFDIRALWRSVLSDWASECPDVKNYKWRLNSGHQTVNSSLLQMTSLEHVHCWAATRGGLLCAILPRPCLSVDWTRAVKRPATLHSDTYFTACRRIFDPPDRFLYSCPPGSPFNGSLRPIKPNCELH